MRLRERSSDSLSAIAFPCVAALLCVLMRLYEKNKTVGNAKQSEIYVCGQSQQRIHFLMTSAHARRRVSVKSMEAYRTHALT